MTPPEIKEGLAKLESIPYKERTTKWYREWNALRQKQKELQKLISEGITKKDKST